MILGRLDLIRRVTFREETWNMRGLGRATWQGPDCWEQQAMRLQLHNPRISILPSTKGAWKQVFLRLSLRMRIAGWHLDFSLVRPWAEHPVKICRTFDPQKPWDDNFVLLWATKFVIICYIEIKNEYSKCSISSKIWKIVKEPGLFRFENKKYVFSQSLKMANYSQIKKWLPGKDQSRTDL